MKRFFKILLAIILILSFSMTAFAQQETPPEPTCEEGEITITPAVWVEGHFETVEVCVDVPIYEYTCPVVNWFWFGHYANVQYVKSQDPSKCHRPSDSDLATVYGMGRVERQAFKRMYPQWLDARQEIVGYEQECHDEEIWHEGYWIPPVCEPEPGRVCEDENALNYLKGYPCEYDEPVPVSKPEPQCKIRYYLLEGWQHSYDCWLTRNMNNRPRDKADELPERFAIDGVLTEYGQSECNKLYRCDEGWTTGNFIWNGTVQYRCNLKCLDCD